MKKVYVVSYWYRDPFSYVQHSGDYYTFNLTDVFAFCAFIERVNGKCSCDI